MNFTRVRDAAALLLFAGCVAGCLSVLGSCQGSDGDILTARAADARLIANGSNPPRGAEAIAALASSVNMKREVPFDGVVMDLGIADAFVSGQRLLAANHEGAVAAAVAADLGPLRTNFQDVNLGREARNWLDDAWFAIALENFETGARLVRQAGWAGLFVDNQAYTPGVWQFPAGSTLSFADHEAEVERRAFLLLERAARGFPGMTVMLTFGASEILRFVCLEGQTLPAHTYALYPAFVRGWARAAAQFGVQIVDAYLPAYPTHEPRHFATYYNLVHARWDRLIETWSPGIVTHWNSAPSPADRRHAWPERPVVTCDRATRDQLSVPLPAGFGLMMDYDLERPFAMVPQEFAANHFSPDAFSRSLATALAVSDGYVWIWQQSFDWFSPAASRPLPPAAYEEAIRAARTLNLPSRGAP